MKFMRGLGWKVGEDLREILWVGKRKGGWIKWKWEMDKREFN